MCILSAVSKSVEKHEYSVPLIIESIAYHSVEGFATITLDTLLRNESSNPIDYYFIHQGRVTPRKITHTLLDYRPNNGKSRKPSQDDVLFLAFKDYFEAEKPISMNYKERIPNWFG